MEEEAKKDTSLKSLENKPKKEKRLVKYGPYLVEEEVAEMLRDIKLHSNTMF